MTADRPATEPRTEAGRDLHALEHQRSGEPMDSEVYCEELDGILAIEAEAAQGAAQTEPNPDAVRRIVAHLWGENFDNIKAAVESFANGYTVVPRAEGPTCVCMNSGCRCSAGQPCGMCAGGDHYYSEGAAPRAEGLPSVGMLAEAIHSTYSIGCNSHALEECPYRRSQRTPVDFEAWAGRVHDWLVRLSRPSDERVPESEEPR